MYLYNDNIIISSQINDSNIIFFILRIYFYLRYKYLNNLSNRDSVKFDEKYVKLITSLANLQTEVNAAKEAGVSIELYIVDVNVDSQVNADIMYDSEYFGGLYGSQTTTFEPAFFYNHEGEYKATVDFNDKNSTASSK